MVFYSLVKSQVFVFLITVVYINLFISLNKVLIMAVYHFNYVYLDSSFFHYLAVVTHEFRL